MCISNSVGNGGVNTPNDVRCVQLLLNMTRDHCGLASDLVVDGLWGPGTRNALGTFCSSIGARSDTPMTDSAETLMALRSGLPDGLNRQTMRPEDGRERKECIRTWRTLGAQKLTN